MLSSSFACLVIFLYFYIGTTVGYGDLTPVTDTGKLFTIGYAFLGIGIVTIALDHIFQQALVQQQALAAFSNKRVLQEVLAEGKTSLVPTRSTMYYVVQGTIPILLTLSIGISIGWIEGWTWLDCIYSATIMITTIGFGDRAPVTALGRGLSTLLLPLIVIAYANAISNITELIRRSQMPMNVLKEQPLSEQSKLEYVTSVLVQMGKVDQEDIDAIIQHYDHLTKKEN